ncbi:hypothetical protein, partial [Accumulibacter sp.]|uniref:hypothetical protein n=1 Tax=Accumulibacter sp. TaxID=2053492 RepID=UPI0026021822
YKILHPYQGDTYFALCSPDAQPVSGSADQFMSMARYVESIGLVPAPQGRPLVGKAVEMPFLTQSTTR